MIFEANVGNLTTEKGNFPEKLKNRIWNAISSIKKIIEEVFFEVNLPKIKVEIKNPDIAPADIKDVLKKNFGNDIKFIWMS